MFKSLAQEVVRTLDREGFQTLTSEGTFDIAAKKNHKLLLIKILTNIDGLNQEQAMSLRAISYFLSAHPFIISEHNNRENLRDNIIYSRFDVPVVTQKLFMHILSNDAVALDSAKGRHTLEVDSELLRKKRDETGMTLEELAQKIGISKKTIYEIENRRVNPTEDTVERLEAVLSIDLRKPYSMKNAPQTYLRPKNEFQKKVSREFSRIGIDNTSVFSAPFEIVGREKFSLITRLSYTVDRGTSIVRKLSRLLSSKAVLIAKKSSETSIEGVPIVLESELPEIETTKELSKLIKEKSE